MRILVGIAEDRRDLDRRAADLARDIAVKILCRDDRHRRVGGGAQGLRQKNRAKGGKQRRGAHEGGKLHRSLLRGGTERNVIT
jgi:hypothetical protein